MSYTRLWEERHAKEQLPGVKVSNNIADVGLGPNKSKNALGI